jgi:phosphoribosylaminoimidazole-succinocarboxamide synthase
MSEKSYDPTLGGEAKIGKDKHLEGKTKCIEPINGNIHDCETVRIITKDALTANDAAKKEELPLAEDKTKQTISIFKLLSKNNIPNSFLTELGSNAFIAQNCRMLPLECVIRRRPHGSYFKRWPGTSSFEIFDPVKTEFYHKHAVVPPVEMCSNPHGIMPDTRMIPEERARELYMKDGEWTHTVYTDPIIEFGFEEWILYPAKEVRIKTDSIYQIPPVVESEVIDYIRDELMLPTFLLLEKAWKKFNVSLIDMKIEVGYNKENKLMVADVIDNDSWRVWPNGDPKQQLDKQSFRDGEDLSEVQKKYRIVTEYVEQFK